MNRINITVLSRLLFLLMATMTYVTPPYAAECHLYKTTALISMSDGMVILTEPGGSQAQRPIVIPDNLRTKYEPFINSIVSASFVVSEHQMIWVKSVTPLSASSYKMSHEAFLQDAGVTECAMRMTLYRDYPAMKSSVILYHNEKLDVWTSKECLDHKCTALQEPTPQPSSNGEERRSFWGGHPAASFCNENKGSYDVLTHENGDQDGVCVFKDGSMIMGWDYYKLFKEHR